MKLFWKDDFATVYQGEALEVLRTLPDDVLNLEGTR